jgi:hypothetical protein
MSWLKTIFAEIWGLFVDDGLFAVAILVWLAIVGGLLPHLGIEPLWIGLILFAGLGAILLESTIRRSRN